MTCVQLCYSSDFGSMEGVSAPHGKLPKAFMPTRVQTRDGSALFVLNHGKPVVTLRSGDRELSFDADAIAWGGGRDDWSVDSARRMVDLLIEDDGLRQAAIELRNAMLLVPLQYAGASGQPIAEPLAASTAAALFDYVSISRKKREQVCSEAFITERIVEKMTEVRQKISTAGEQMERCLGGCGEKFPAEGTLLEQGINLVARAACSAACLVTAFVDIVVGFVEVVVDVVREVVTRVVVCQTPPPEHIAVPYEGRFVGVGAFATSGIDSVPKGANPASADFKKLADLLKTFGSLSGVAECLLSATWEVKDLRDLGYQGVGDVFPISFSICFDGECVKKLIAAGPGQIVAALTEISGLLSAGPVAAAAAKISLSFALKVLSVAVVVLAYQVLAVVGQLLFLKALGKTQNGVCLNHPTVIVGLVGILTGPLGILSGGVAALNTPFIVTPR